MFDSLVWGSPTWLAVAAVVGVAAAVALVYGYRKAPGNRRVRVMAASLKAAGMAMLLVCLLEPMVSGTRARPQANLFVLLADDSCSLEIRDPGGGQSRADQATALFADTAAWQQRLRQDFDVRRYAFAERLRAVDRGQDLSFTGGQSSLATALQTVARRFQGRPLAGVLVLTDGNATDLAAAPADWSGLPPVYPVPLGTGVAARDISLQTVSATQTNFEQSPVSIRADVATAGYDGRELMVQLLDASGVELQSQTVEANDQEARTVRFRMRSDPREVSFYRVRAAAKSELADIEAPERSPEATLANNSQLVTIVRPTGPYRVLYVAGRPNWEFPFLRRAMSEDREVELVGLLRLAKREPKFAFLGRAGDSANPLYRGFTDRDAEETESYDQPVFIRVGIRDESELRDGFPKPAEELFAYHAVIVDDTEAEFFNADQLLLLQRFVSRRGGGFLMLGGAESLRQGGYARTPVGEMLPVYLDRSTAAPPAGPYRWSLTREGWLEPWLRLSDTEELESERLERMAEFQVLNTAGNFKPGGTVLATVSDGQWKAHPALVSQPFGHGRTAALLVGDWWRWGLKREFAEQNELATAWRQTVRWLVADVPRRVELSTAVQPGGTAGQRQLRVEVRDPEYQPLDNALVELTVTGPEGKGLQLRARPDERSSGSYVATYVPREPGMYRVKAVARAADGSEIGRREGGWASEPAADEFRRLVPDTALLERIAEESGGELVEAETLDAFVADLPNRDMPNSEPWVWPLWHQPLVLLLALACLTAEWGLRRWKGLP
jgi:hypothetical protein